MRSLVRTLLLAALLAALSSTSLLAEEPVSLALKFTQGEAVNYDVTFSGAGSLVAPDGTRSTLTLQGSYTFTETPVQIDADGAAVLETLLPKADVTISVKGQQVRFSYADGKVHWFAQGKEQTPPQQDLSKFPLLSMPIRVSMKPNGSITEIAFTDTTFLDLLRKALPSLGSTPLPSLSAVNTSPLLPSAPVRVGESWSTEKSIPILAGDSASYRSRRTLESMTANLGVGLAKLSGFSEVRYRGRPSSLAGPGGQSISVSIPDLRQTVASTEFFNVGLGRLMRGDYDMQFTTKVSVAAAGQTQGGRVEARLRATITTR